MHLSKIPKGEINAGLNLVKTIFSHETNAFFCVKATYLRDMQVGFIHTAFVIQIYSNFAVTFYPANRFDNNFITHFFSLRNDYSKLIKPHDFAR